LEVETFPFPFCDGKASSEIDHKNKRFSTFHSSISTWNLWRRIAWWRPPDQWLNIFSI